MGPRRGDRARWGVPGCPQATHTGGGGRESGASPSQGAGGPSTGRGSKGTASVGFDKRRVLPLRAPSRLLAATRRHVATCHVPSTASSGEAEGLGLFSKTWQGRRGKGADGRQQWAKPCPPGSPQGDPPRTGAFASGEGDGGSEGADRLRTACRTSSKGPGSSGQSRT